MHLGRACRSIAYPYGEVDVRVAALAREVGYETGACLADSRVPLGAHCGLESASGTTIRTCASA